MNQSLNGYEGAEYFWACHGEFDAARIELRCAEKLLGNKMTKINKAHPIC